jgi:hypothetical protein
VGAAWARLLCDSMTQQGRAVLGGWPGTMLEARARVARQLDDELVACGMPPLRKDELDLATNAAYAQAKKDWLAVERATKASLRGGLRHD